MLQLDIRDAEALKQPQLWYSGAMKSLREEIEAGVTRALVQLVGPEGAAIDPIVRPTQEPKFGDYQSNVALGLAKKLGRKPREVAEALVAALGLDEVCETPEIAGPGFINFRLRPDFLSKALSSIQADPRLGIAPTESPERVVVDYSSPNVAKAMHVGHLRSTIIGDTIARLLEFQGHDVLRLNHLGDWGTQFGMLIQHLRETAPEVTENPEGVHIADLEAFYIAAKARFDQETDFQDRARQAVVELQSGDPQARAIWEVLCTESMRHATEVYELLDIRGLETRGESFYNPMLPEVVAELEAQGLAVESQGAVCVFLDGYKNKEGAPLPLIVRKSGGGYNYDTTDLAGVRHRVGEEQAKRIVYVTDKRQAQHFAMVFDAAQKAGWVPGDVRLEHVGFGMVLGPNRKPFATRDGGTVKLVDLLQEAEARALQAALAIQAKGDDERRQTFSADEMQSIAQAIGIGSVKYADLSHNLTTDYVFDWDTMLALEGNTALYMLYAYVRTRGIARKAGLAYEELPTDLPITVEHESEIALAKQLLNFGAVIRQVSDELRPHHLTDYLYSLSRAYSGLFDRERGVRVIDAAPESVRLSRLRLCDLTARALKLGLNLLGIRVLERM
ncbi:MAG: arginyl-tRNA synthetase [Armatimonadetes bacterium]|nr:arginyl-tRNA synthetase [Armatimonadota bacterium]